jgi:type IV pilus assembly protein PilF
MGHKWAKLLSFHAPFLLGLLSLLAIGCGAGRDVTRSQNRLDIARDLLSKGEAVGAESEAKRSLKHDPQNEEAENILGLTFVVRAHQNIQLIEKSECLSEEDAAGLRGEADAQMRAAEEHFSRAVELAPSYGEAWANRAVVAMYFHDWDRAIEHAKKALANPERLESTPLAHANLGWSHYQKQDYAQAVTELLQANQGARYFCLGKFRLASVYFARKEFERVAETLQPMFDNSKLCPPIQEAQWVGGQAFVRLRDRDAAAKAFGACIEMAPKSCQARDCRKALAEVSPKEAE